MTAVSCVLYLLSCMIYEAFLMMLLVFGAAACAEESRKPGNFGRYLLRVITNILPQTGAAALYAAAHLTWQHFYPTEYGGISFCLTDPVFSLRAVGIYATSYFPLNAAAHLSKDAPVGMHQLLAAVSVPGIVKAGLLSAAFVLTVRKIAPRLRFRGMLLTAVTGMLSPCILIGFSQKYLEQARRGVISYVPSFYSALFMAVVLCGGSCVIYRLLRGKNLRRLFLVLLGCTAAGLSLSADVTVQYWRAHYAALDVRYRNFDRAAESEVVTQCDADWQIYAPDNGGIHNLEPYTLQYLSIYDETPAGHYVIAPEQLQPDTPTVCLRSDPGYQLTIAGETDAELTAQEVTVFTVLPGEFTLRMHTADGEEIVCEGVHDGSVLRFPEGIDLGTRVEATLNS